MNRIICDICGSEYPETADRCPICSYPRQGTEKLVAAGAAAAVEKVKGGRFSSKNVKKRRKQQQKAAAAAAASEELPEKNPNKPLWIVIIILLIAILLVSAYIGVRFFRGRDMFLGGTTTAGTTLPPQTTVPPTVPCEAIGLETNIILDEVGQEHQIVLKLTPENTTDAVTYVSSDPAVAEVTEQGMVIANGTGEATITVTCGNATAQCKVFCWLQEETTLPPETTAPVETAAPTEPPKATEAPKATKPAEPKPTEAKELKLDVTDASCFTQGEVFTISVKLGSQSVSRSKVTWTTSDPNVATVEKGTVTAVGKGTATITAEYEGKKATCVVRCRFEDTSWKASASDVTLGVGESFRLSVTNNSGETADAIWTMNLDGVVSIDGKTVTGRAPGTVTLTTTVDGVTLSCIVRVK